MSRRLPLLILLITALSMAMLVGSNLAQGLDEWWSTLLLDAGLAILLLIPFILVTRLVESWFERSERLTASAIGQTRDAVAHLESEIDDTRKEFSRTTAQISEQIADRLANEWSEDNRLFDAVKSSPSHADVRIALQRACELGVIGRLGVRVPLAPTSMYVHFHVPGENGSIAVAIQGPDTEVAVAASWEEGIGPVDFFLGLVPELRGSRFWEGDAFYAPGSALEGLSAVLKRGMVALRQGTGSLLPIFEIGEHEDWIVTDDGIINPAHSYYIDFSRFNEDWDRHMRGKTWVDISNFRAAYDVGEALIRSGLVEGNV